jgi:nicotine blue oxidoreductase
VTRGVAAAVLAAGGGSRFAGDTPKVLAELGGRPLVAHAVDAAVAGGLRPVLLVVGELGDDVAVHAPGEVEIVRNRDWRDGIASSLRAVLHALEPRDEIGAVVVGLADQPFVGSAAYERLAAAYDAGARLAAATYEGRRANPVLVAREHWHEASALEGDEGARQLMRRHAVVEVSCDGTGDPTDVDTTEDLAALEARWRSTTASE